MNEYSPVRTLSADKHLIARMSFNAFTHCALAPIPHSCLCTAALFHLGPDFLHSLCDFRQECDRAQLFDYAIGKSFVRLPHRATVPFFFILANRDAWWWPRRLLHLLLFASGNKCLSNVHVLRQWETCLCLLRSQHGPFIFLVPWWNLLTQDCIDIVRLPDIHQYCLFCPFRRTLELITSFAIQVGSFAATNSLFSLVVFPVLKTNTLVVSI